MPSPNCRFKSRYLRLLVGAPLLFSLSSLPAAANPETTRQAQEALAQGKANEAMALLAPLHASGQADNQSLFLLAMSAKQLDDWAASERYLAELLQREPAAARVKLELAEVYFRNGQPKKAKQLLLEAKMANPPTRVGENIDAFLAFIEHGAPKTWNAYASLGLVHDSNANQGPSIDTVLIYNLPFTLDRDARGNSDWAHTLKAGANYTHALRNGVALQAGIHLNYVDYWRLDSFDTANLSFSAGPSWSTGAWKFSTPYIFNTVRFGHSQSYYSISQGLAPQVGYQVSPKLLVQGSMAWQDKRYKDNSPRNSDALTFNSSIRYSLDESSHLSLGGYVGEEKAGIDIASNRSHGIGIDYFKAFDKHLSLHVSPAYSHTDYDGIEAAFQKGREDTRYDFSASLNYLIAPWNANLTLSFTASYNRSSIEMYRYTRRQTMVSLTKNF